MARIESSSGSRWPRGVDFTKQAGGSLKTIVGGSIENTRQASEGAGQASEASGDLARQAEELMAIVGQFKVEDD